MQCVCYTPRVGKVEETEPVDAKRAMMRIFDAC